MAYAYTETPGPNGTMIRGTASTHGLRIVTEDVSYVGADGQTITFQNQRVERYDPAAEAAQAEEGMPDEA